MYDCRFLDAVNSHGDRIRNNSSGEFVSHCGHRWIVKIRETHPTKSFGGLEYVGREFDGFEMICLRCGEVDWIGAPDFVTSVEWEKRVEDAARYVGLTYEQRWKKEDADAKRGKRRKK